MANKNETRHRFGIPSAAAFAILLMLSAGSAKAAGASGEVVVRGCIQGAVTVSVISWGLAIIAAPFTGGASLAAIPAVDAVVGSAALGCAAGALGSGVAHAVTGSN